MRLSASNVYRAMVCPASAVLPGVDSTTAAGDLGTAKHAVIIPAVERWAASCKLPDKSTLDLRPLLGFFAPGIIGGEVSFALNPETGEARFLGYHLGREYALQPGEIGGTCDLLQLSADETTAVLHDIKTGQRVQPVAENDQLRTLAAMVARTYDLERVFVGIDYLDDDGEWSFETATFDAIDLDSFVGSLGKLLVRVKETEAIVERGTMDPDVTVGTHCRYCPAVRACPAHTALVRFLPPTLADIAPAIESMTPTQLGESWETLVKCESLLKVIRDGLEACARIAPLELPDGRVVREVETSRESIDAAIAHQALVDMGVSRNELATAIDLSVTKASLKRALNGRAGDALDAIRTAGGVKVKASTAVREVKR